MPCFNLYYLTLGMTLHTAANNGQTLPGPPDDDHYHRLSLVTTCSNFPAPFP
jgi:hypothetical protein